MPVATKQIVIREEAGSGSRRQRVGQVIVAVGDEAAGVLEGRAAAGKAVWVVVVLAGVVIREQGLEEGGKG